MSRARSWTDANGEKHWFDNRSPATAKQLELLADVEGIDLDDLLDEDLSQKQVLWRLNTISELIPPEVLQRRRERRERVRIEPACRICTANGWTCEGRITRHHFVNRWLMLELSNYTAYAPRSRCTIPVCVGRHRDLHYRGEGATADKSIVGYLTDKERRLADKMLTELREEHSAIYELMLGGNAAAYEYQLIRDHTQGRFRHQVKVQDVILPSVTRLAQA